MDEKIIVRATPRMDAIKERVKQVENCEFTCYDW